MYLTPKWMTAAEAIAWIVSQDEAFAFECKSYSPLKLAIRIAERRAFAQDSSRLDPWKARQDLARKCGEGLIASSGRISNTGRILSEEHQQISKEAWLSLRIDPNGNRYIARDEENKVLLWRSILFDREDVRREFQDWSSAECHVIHSQTTPRLDDVPDYQPRNEGKSRPGRKLKYDPEPIRRKVFELMNEMGEFKPGCPSWNAQARLEEKVEYFMNPTGASDVPPATVRRYARRALASWRASQSQSANRNGSDPI